MNFSAFFGVLLAVLVAGGALFESGVDPVFFLNFHGIVIVCGGTFSAAAIMYPMGKLLGLLKIFFLRVLGRHKTDYQGVIEQILELNKKASIGGITALNDLLPAIRHEFLREAVQLVAGGVLSEKELRNALDQRIKTTERRLLCDSKMFGNIGRFPPAFGLLAASLGMIALLQQIGKPGSENLIGPAMSIGLVGTLYGIGVANFIFLPIAENLAQRADEEVALRKMIVEGIVMIKSQTNPISMRENLNSFLLPKDRVVRKAA